MGHAITPAMMRQAEAAAMASGAVSGRDLMERAGAGVVAVAAERWPVLEDGSGRAVVLCGPGNNGGDGYVIARLLRERGCDVRLFALGAAQTDDARAMQAAWERLGITEPLSALGGQMVGPGVVVFDALFGTGLARPLPDIAAAALRMVQESGAALVAVDILSGVDAESGAVLENGALTAPCALTVTFEMPRYGHVLAPGAALAGEVVAVPIGIARWLRPLVDSDPLALELAGPGTAGIKGQGHKYEHGAVLALAGGVGHGGAGRLAARAALRIGAGAVTLACPPAAMIENAARLDAVMLARLDGPEEAAALAAGLKGRPVVLAGPGLGVERAAALVPALAGPGRALVLDADALTAFAGRVDTLAALAAQCREMVLTPHPGEFARLFADLAADLARGASKVAVTRAAASRAGATVLLKGPDTVIAAPDGSAAVHPSFGPHAVPWLATAGAGDVLAGFIAGLLARGAGGFRAAVQAAWLHAECARSFGPGLIAEDLADELPKVLRRLGDGAAARRPGG